MIIPKILISKKYKINKIYMNFLMYFIITSILSLIIWGTLSEVEHWNTPAGYDQTRKNVDFFDIFYFNSITWFTVGFGDFTPKHPALKTMVILNVMCAYTIVTLDF